MIAPDERKDISGALVVAAAILVAVSLVVTFMPVCEKPAEPTPAPPNYSAELSRAADALEKIASRETSLVVPPNHAIVKPCPKGHK